MMIAEPEQDMEQPAMPGNVPGQREANAAVGGGGEGTAANPFRQEANNPFRSGYGAAK